MKHEPTPEPEEIDGGVTRHTTVQTAPKLITSTEIVEFSCECSLLAICEPGELENRVYQLKAFAKGNHIVTTFQWHDHSGEGDKHSAEASPLFLQKLQEIVSEHDFARYNGYCHRVNGLPDMYGASLNIRYRNGESIYAYDNEDCFLPYEAMRDLITLFTTDHKLKM